MKRALFLLACLPLVSMRSAQADSLVLNTQSTFTINGLANSSIGDLAIDDGNANVWLASGTTNGLVYRVNLGGGSIVQSVDPAVIPGLHLGPDALAIVPTGAQRDLIVFSSFSESEGGRITQAGALVTDFGTSNSATGADFDSAGNLWVATGTAVGGGSVLKRVNPATGAVLQSVPILGNSARVVDLAFDPNTGACYCLLETSPMLVEVSLTTGAIVSTTDLSPFLSYTNQISGGFDFRHDGLFLYFCIGGAQSTSATVVLLRRDFATSVCDGSGAVVACPCGNAGLPGHGCANSVNANGAQLTGVNAASVVSDSFVLQANGLPASASCLFFQGATNPTPAIFGDGLRCVVGNVIRLGTVTATNGNASYPRPNDPHISVRGQIPANGGSRFYQAWYRNPANFCTASTFNLSNAVSVHWGP